jgi:DNA-binding CsgD family transcriptional regulator
MLKKNNTVTLQVKVRGHDAARIITICELGQDSITLYRSELTGNPHQAEIYKTNWPLVFSCPAQFIEWFSGFNASPDSGIAAPITATPSSREAKYLTEREREVSSLLLKGLSTKAIALSLSLSPFTVADHLKSIYLKLGVHSRGELMNQLYKFDSFDGYENWLSKFEHPHK